MSSNVPATLADSSLANYVIMQDGQIDDLTETIQENSTGGPFSARNLPRVKVPGAAGTMWQLETAEGEKNVEALRGVLIHHQPKRIYYAKSVDEGEAGAPPDCQSNDKLVGYGVRWQGDPQGAHDCLTCPLAAWGQDSQGNRIKPRCAERRNLYLITEDRVLPILIDLPPTSLKGFNAYMNHLIGSATPFYGVITELTLKKEPAQGKRQAYSYVVFNQVDTIPRHERARLKEFRRAIEALVSQPDPAIARATITNDLAPDDIEEIDL